MSSKKRERNCEPAEQEKSKKEILRLQMENRTIQDNIDILKRNLQSNKKIIGFRKKELKSCK
jgi:hypothetical protein